MLSTAFADMTDLMAAEGKYHLQCSSKYQRDAKDINDDRGKYKVAKACLISLLKSSSKVHIPASKAVWQCHTNLCKETRRSKTFYQSQSIIQGKI